LSITCDIFSLILLTFLTDIDNMALMTAKEIGEELGLNPHTAKMRLIRAGIEPVRYYGNTAVYNASAVEKIREVSKGGRPKKAKD